MLINLPEPEVRAGIEMIAREFPGSELAFDTAGTHMAKTQDKNDLLKKMAARIHWTCDDPRRLEGWGTGLRLLESRTLAGAQPALQPNVRWFLRTLGPILFRKQVNSYRLNLFEVT